jgi:ubiquitin-protein ligase
MTNNPVNFEQAYVLIVQITLGGQFGMKFHGQTCRNIQTSHWKSTYCLQIVCEKIVRLMTQSPEQQKTRFQRGFKKCHRRESNPKPLDP